MLSKRIHFSQMQAFVVADCTQREVNIGRASIQHLGRNLFSQPSKDVGFYMRFYYIHNYYSYIKHLKKYSYNKVISLSNIQV